MILLDHCVPRRYLGLLQAWGYDANAMTDHIPADAPDSDVIALAAELDAVLLTVDLDFANILDYPPAVRLQASVDACFALTLNPSPSWRGTL